jgi:hypothetical protein
MEIQMMEWMRRLSGRKAEAPKFDLEHAVGAYLLELPRCPSHVVIAGPRYDAKHFIGEVIADAALLLPWAEHHAEAVWSLACDEQAARKTLPIWLRGADLSQKEPAYLPAPFFQVLGPYAETLINKEVAVAHCPECGQAVSDLAMQQLDKRMVGTWHYWTAEWRCENNHLIYREDHELHFF